MPTDLESRDKLRQRNKEEVQIEKELELFIQDDGNESEHIVLLISDNVWRESRLELVYKRIMSRL